MTLGIRAVTIEDADSLLRLYGQLGKDNAASDERRIRLALAEIIADRRMHLLVLDGNVVGTATLVVVPNLTHDGKPWAQLENMIVDESERRNGIGRALLDACKQAAWDAGCYKMQLQSANARDGAHRFYEQGGFVASSRGYRLYRYLPSPKT